MDDKEKNAGVTDSEADIRSEGEPKKSKPVEREKLKEGVDLVVEATSEELSKAKDSLKTAFQNIDGDSVRHKIENELTNIKQFKFDWANWSVSEKTIIVSACAALISLFMPWVDLGIASRNGFSMLWGLPMMGAFAYPVHKVLSEGLINQKIAYSLAGASSVFCVIWMFNNQMEIFGKSVNVSGSGLFLFFVCLLALTWGLWKHKTSP